MYICPICDQAMKSRHYCRVCKSWVKTPIEREVTYYLNERHPGGETGCEYHIAPAAGAGKAVPGKKKRKAAGRQEKAPSRPAGEADRTVPKRAKKEKEKKKKSASDIISIIAAIIAFLAAIMSDVF